MDVANKIVHQTSYSKFELGKIDLVSEHFVALLNNIEMSYDEFEYIYNGYDLCQRKNIIAKFTKLKYINSAMLIELISESERYLSKNNDRYIRDIYYVCKGLYIYESTKSFKEAIYYANKVWDRIQNLDTWYLSDIRLINNILYLFPSETAFSITKMVLEQLKKYKDLIEFNQLTLPLKYNLVHLYIKEEKYEDAYILNDELINEFQKQKVYVHIALCFLRKGILQKKMALHQEVDYIGKAYIISKIFNDTALEKQLQETEKYFTKLMML